MTDKRTGKKIKRAAAPTTPAGNGLAALPVLAAPVSKKKHK